MKLNIIFFTVLSALLMMNCGNSGNKTINGNPKIEFSQTDFDFGNVKQGEKVSHRFVFKNSGDGDLIIKRVEPDCGCTIVNLPKEPIHPNGESFIEATFDSDGYRGLCVKGIKVDSNAEPSTITLTFSANVLVEEE